jgi:hypothetical protein
MVRRFLVFFCLFEDVDLWTNGRMTDILPSFSLFSIGAKRTEIVGNISKISQKLLDGAPFKLQISNMRVLNVLPPLHPTHPFVFWC